MPVKSGGGFVPWTLALRSLRVLRVPASVADRVGDYHTLGGFCPVTGWVNVIRTDEAPPRRRARPQRQPLARSCVDLRKEREVIKYVDTVRQDGSGFAVPLRGGARLQVTVVAPAHDGNYRQTYRPANRTELVNVAGWQTFRQIAWAGSFEGQSTIGLGVRARLPFRVFVLQGPGAGSRFVIDVAHRW